MIFRSRNLGNIWTDTITGSFTATRSTSFKPTQRSSQRCLLMTTDPGDLVLDPTCGSGTTAYVAEQWGRRWITCDISRVPLALARQRLLTATFPWYKLKDEPRGPAGGFVYKRKQNQKGRGSRRHRAARHAQEHRQQRTARRGSAGGPPGGGNEITRVTGPLSFEATIPTADDAGRGARDAGHPVRADDEPRRRPDAGSAAQQPGAAAARQPDRDAEERSAARQDSALSPRQWWTCRRPRTSPMPATRRAQRPVAGGVRVRPGERRGERDSWSRSAAMRPRSRVHAPLRHRLRHPAQRPGADREVRQ